MDVEAEPLARGRGAPQFVPALVAGRQPQAADAVPPGGLAGLGLKRAIERDRALHEPRQVLGTAQLPDQAGGVPGRAVGQLTSLQQQHVARAAAREVIGDGAADGTAADDHDRGLPRDRRRRHGVATARSSSRYQPTNCATLRSFSVSNGPGR